MLYRPAYWGRMYKAMGLTTLVCVWNINQPNSCEWSHLNWRADVQSWIIRPRLGRAQFSYFKWTEHYWNHSSSSATRSIDQFLFSQVTIYQIRYTKAMPCYLLAHKYYPNLISGYLSDAIVSRWVTQLYKVILPSKPSFPLSRTYCRI